MRLEKLELKNLNSLAGSWSVDFRNRDLVCDGIFLIAGATGAGKTTLLDAVCLALYGRTPRIPSISKSTNEVMSRHTGECMARLTYSVPDGEGRRYYEASWSQHRARGRREGGLQEPSRRFLELHLDEDGVLLPKKGTGAGERKSEFDRLVLETTGMDFEQFTRSMMLAQGEFSKFLNSKSQDRSALLEKITGTNVYSDISRRCHERTQAETAELARRRDEASGVRLLTAEERASRNAEASRLKDDLEAHRKARAELESVIAWFAEWDRAREAVGRVERDGIVLKAEEEAFAPSGTRLSDDARARRAADAIAAKEAALRHERQCAEALEASARRLPEQEAAEKEAGDALREAQARKASAREKEPARREEIAAMRLQDADTAHLAKERDAAEARARKAGKDLEGARRDCEAKRDELAGTAGNLEDIGKALAAAAADAGLAEAFTGIEEQLRGLAERTSAAGAARKNLEDLGRKTEQARKALEAAQGGEDRAAAERHALEKRRAALIDQISAATGDEPDAVLSARKDRLSALKGALAPFDSAVGELRESVRALADIDAGLVNIRTVIAPQRSMLEEVERTVAASKMALEQSERRLRWAERVMSLEDMRKGLVPGNPCPCCGATDHPFATRLPEMGEEDRACEQARAAYDRSLERQRTAAKALASSEQEKATLRGRRQGAEQRAESAANVLREMHASLSKHLDACRDDLPGTTGLPALGPGMPGAETVAGVCAMLGDWHGREGREIARLAAAAEHVLSQRLSLQTKLAEAASLLDAAHRKAADAARALDAARLTLDAAEREERRAGEDAGNADTALRERMEELCARLAPFGVSEKEVEAETKAEAPGMLLEALRTRRDDYAALARSRQETEERSRVLTVELKAREERVREAGTAEKARAEEAAEAVRRHEAACEERRNKYGDATPDQTEKALEKELAACDEAVDESMGRHVRATQELEKAKGSVEAQKKALEDAGERRRRADETLLQAIAAAGFADEGALRAALLGETEREELERTRDLLARRRIALVEQEANARKAAAELEGRRPRAEDRQEAEEALGATQAREDETNRRLGAIGEALSRDDEERRRHAGLIERIEAQVKVCDRWRRLNDLIGSFDGKKLRDYAQGLTLRTVIHNANVELVRLTDRYSLVQDPAEPLGILVVDHHQADERRPTANLSGGESFLVSLALALGLSALARGRVNIETMFLDEGFGTLDPASLQAAVDTLANLRGGRCTVGVISHVEILRERIPAHIDIVRTNGGTSRVSGPGVSGSAPEPAGRKTGKGRRRKAG